MKQKAVADLLDQSNKQAIERTRIQKNQQEQLFLIHEQNNKLRKEIEVLKMNLAAKKAKRGELRRSFSLQQCLLEKKMKFVCLEEDKDENECTNMSCCFHVATKIPLTVNQGEALIQFEEEAVAQQLIRKHNHIINLENKEVALKACPVALAMGTKFKTHVKLSQKAMRVSNIPNVDIAEEWMREKLELLFYKAKLGEIQSIIYDPFLQEATVTFCQPIALNEIIWHGQYGINVFGKTHFLTVSPLRQINVEKVQMFSGTSRKAVLLIGINAEQKDEENVEDMIEIHFQKPSNGGGEVDRVTYIPKEQKLPILR
uniref:N-myc and STAT interactor n=1 Tax=Naja naja TaxID=35670 RepID=A0A8C6YI03_NAJNA